MIGAIQRFRSSRKSIATLVGFAIFCDMFVYGILIPILPRTLKSHAIEESQLGNYLSVYSFGMVVTPIVAILSDTYRNRKIPMCLSSMLLSLATMSFALGRDPPSFLFGRIGQGIAGGISWMIGFSMLADTFPANLGTTMGSVMSANTIGNLLGPPIGGILYDTMGMVAPLYFCASVCVIDTLVRLTIRSPIVSWDYPHFESNVEDRPLLQDDTDTDSSPKSKVSFWKLIANLEMIITLSCIIVGEGVLTGIEPTLPIYLAEKLQLTTSSIGLLWIFISVPKMFACTGAGVLSDKYGRKSITALGLLILSIACVLVSLSTTLFVLAPSLSLFGIGAGVALTPGVPEMAEISKSLGDSSYGTVYSLYNFASSSGMLLGPILGSWVYGNHDFSLQMVVFGCLSASMFVLISIYKRRQTTQPVE